MSLNRFPPTYIPLADLQLEPTDEVGYLLGSIQIGTACFHVEALAVDTLNGHPYELVNPAFQSRIDGVLLMDDADDHQRVLIDGKPHLILIYPFQR